MILSSTLFKFSTAEIILCCSCLGAVSYTHLDVYKRQLQDDVLDVWGDEATFGKAIGGDIMNNKKTFLLIGAMQKAQGDDANELRRWINNDYALRSEKVPAVTALYERLGMREAADEAIKRYDDMAFDALSKVEMSDKAREAFVQLIKGLVGRKK